MQPKKKSFGAFLLKAVLILTISLLIAGVIKYVSGAAPFHANATVQPEITLPKLSLPTTPKQVKLEEHIFLPLALRSDEQQVKILKDRKSTRLNSSHRLLSRMPSSA